MKRHPAFQDLSRDHYVALNRSLQVVRAVDGHPNAWKYSEALSAFKALWRAHGLREHFGEEETDLVPVLRGRNEGAELATRMLREHEELRARFEGLDAATPNDVRDTAKLLTAHARWEEDTVFEWLQATLTEAELQALLAKSMQFRTAKGRPVGPPRR